LKILL